MTVRSGPVNGHLEGPLEGPLEGLLDLYREYIGPLDIGPLDIGPYLLMPPDAIHWGLSPALGDNLLAANGTVDGVLCLVKSAVH